MRWSTIVNSDGLKRQSVATESCLDKKTSLSSWAAGGSTNKMK
jgi:hypothetical protein